MNRKVFITLAIGFLLTFNAHSTPTMTNERQANAKLLFKAKLRAAWANGPALAPDISSRFAKQGVITDGVSTALALAGGAKELNPLLGASPSPLTLVGFTAIKVAYVNHLTLRPNQQAQARAAGLCALGSLGDGATANNLSVLIGASTGLPLAIGAWVTSTRYNDCMRAAQTAYLTHVAPQLWAEAQHEARLQR